MGSISAMSSIQRVIDQHGDEIRQEMTQDVPSSILPHFRGVELVNNNYSIETLWLFDDAYLAGPSLDIDELADRFPDCDVAY